jgi:myosin heavy subunit
LLDDIRSYRYLTQGNILVNGEDDIELYRQVLEAMDVLGFTKEDIVCMFFCC